MISITINGKSFNIDDNDRYRSFWHKAEMGRWEPETFKIFDKYIMPDKSFIDIGAWIGVTSLYGSLTAKSCYSFEPDRIAFQEFITNINLNPLMNIFPFMSCIADNTGFSTLFSKTSFGDSQSSIVGSEIDNKSITHSFNIMDFIKVNKIEDVNFVKMDIEGGESIVLPSMIDYLKLFKPTLYLSVHPYWFHDREEGSNAVIKACSLYKYILDSSFNPIDITRFEDKINRDDLEGISNKDMEIILTDIDIDLS